MKANALLYEGTVALAHDGQRLDQVLQSLLSCSRRQARLTIAQGQVQLGRKTCRISAKAVSFGQRLTVRPRPAEAKDLVGDSGPGAQRQVAERTITLGAPLRLSLLYIDAHVVAVHKPAGLLSERDRFAAPSVESVLPQVLAAQGERTQLWLVHRLDAGTSGVLLLARSKAAARALNDAFRARRVQKVYWALCAGTLDRAVVVEAALARKRGCQQGVFAAQYPGAKPATTAFSPLSVAAHASFVQARPITGRSHQIRVHLQHIGHPILGDGLYGGPRYLPSVAGDGQRDSVPRTMLHAHLLRLAHPVKAGQTLDLIAPAPADFLTTAQRAGLSIPPAARPARPL